MKIFLDCLPCMLRQVLEAASMATDQENVHECIMDEAVKTLADYRSYSCSPKMCEVMHGIVKRHTGVADPYEKIKERDISEAIRLEPLIKDFALSHSNLIYQALKVSATGNVMDSALFKDLDIESCLAAELEKPFAFCDLKDFEKDLIDAKQILIIGDNAGEVVFDKVLAKLLSRQHQVIFGVRDEPIINDATVEDAVKAGMDEYAEIISTGCGAPGVILDQCSLEFRQLFDSADVVISKGQGNFEALFDAPGLRQVYFLFKAKCPRIAKILDVEVSEYIFKNSR